ncbi:MAG: AAA family ATPase [Gammaproteobacteria bacterium]
MSTQIARKPAVRDGLEPSADFDRALALIEGGDQHVFITGRAGTGKTTLLHLLRDETIRNVAVVAPTGLSAIHVGGQTIHSFFRLPPRFVDPQELRAMRHTGVMKALDLLVIDEVSMVRADLMDGIDKVLRLNRRNDEPFGGVQLAMFGDLWQLPPVVREAELKEYFEETYGGPYFFQALVWRECAGRSVDLQKIYRQKDDAGFRNILQSIRDGEPDEETLRALNARVISKASLPDPDSHIVLTATTQAAMRENSRRLAALPGKVKRYAADVSGKFDATAFPTESELLLKVGAKVMFLKNDPERRWINGSWGIVTALGDDGPSVQLEDGTEHEVGKTAWENLSYRYDRASRQITREQIGAFRQLPLRLGWAITIHKSQGQTFDRVYIDLGHGAFSHGQTYVALSRCRSLEGLALARPVRERDVILDQQIGDYRRVFPAAV